MPQQRRTLCLPNGMKVHLISRPDATRAAALVQAGVGSHDEPEAWPGLAHLLEHLLFAGSRDFHGSDRLMAWVQAAGGRVNATTLATATAFFFEASAQQFEAGLARLVDMLAFPLLSPEAQQQETAIIDAEYRLLQTHTETLCAAALMQTFTGPAALHRFHVGSLAAFGDDPAALQQALRDYHRRFYHAANMTLWLSGPFTPDDLARLARRYGERLPAAPAPCAPVSQPVTPAPRRHLAVKVRGVPRLQLAFLLPAAIPARALTLLRQLVTDEADQGLLATLRARGVCDGLQVQVVYRSAQAWVISLTFSGSGMQPPWCAEAEALFYQWRQALASLSGSHLRHYARLADRQACQQSPMDSLREQAFGFPPVGEVDAGFMTGWQQLLASLTPEQMTRLWAAPDVTGEALCVQGFPLIMGDFLPETSTPTDPPTWRFHPVPYNERPAALPAEAVPLPHLRPAKGEGVLLLRPAAGSDLSGAWGHTVQCALRALAGDLAHRGGELTFARYQGIWLLTCRGDDSTLAFALHHLTCALRNLPENAVAQGQRAASQERETWRTEIPVRALLNQLPRVLTGHTGQSHALPTPWAACLYGGNKALHDRLSHLLADFPGIINAPAGVSVLSSLTSLMADTTSQDAALLLFCPLVEANARTLAAWQLLAMLYEPRFFQRLRVEMNIGYVVSCRFHHSADRPGILFALQSPHLTAVQLLRHTQDFLNEMTAEIAALPPETLTTQQEALLTLQHPAGNLIDRAWAAWQNPPLTETAVRCIDLLALGLYHRQLCDTYDHWVVLTAGQHQAGDENSG